jgi:UDP-3-O-acyl-N-acetylglucosamine deacetylase
MGEASNIEHPRKPEGNLEPMQMPRLRLTDPVLIEGTGPLGPASGKAGIWLRPTDEPGWFWKKKDGTKIPIDLNMVKEGGFDVHPRHYLYFQDGKEKLLVVEHLLALRFLGLDAVEIEVAEGAGDWVPYDGSAELYWQKIEKHLKYDGVLKPSVLHTSDSYTTTDENGVERTVRLDTTNPKNPEFVVNVKIDYPRFGGALPDGKQEITQRFPLHDPTAMLDVIQSRPLLQPAWLEPMLRMAYKGGIWPHFNQVLKQSEFDPNDPTPYLREVARHRMLDFLAALAMTMNAGEYLTGSASSERAGHATDVALLKKVAAKMSQ